MNRVERLERDAWALRRAALRMLVDAEQKLAEADELRARWCQPTRRCRRGTTSVA